MLKSKNNERINKMAIYDDLQSKLNNKTIDFYYANCCKLIEELDNNRINTCKTFNGFLLNKGYSRGGSFYKYKQELMNAGLLKIENKNLVFIVPQKYLETHHESKLVDNKKSESKANIQQGFVEYIESKNKEYSSSLDEKLVRGLLNKFYKNEIYVQLIDNNKRKEIIIDMIEFIENAVLPNSEYCLGREKIVSEVNTRIEEAKVIKNQKQNEIEKKQEQRFQVMAELIDTNKIQIVNDKIQIVNEQIVGL